MIMDIVSIIKRLPNHALYPAFSITLPLWLSERLALPIPSRRGPIIIIPRLGLGRSHQGEAPMWGVCGEDRGV